MHMISKKDLRDAEMDTLTKSCSPTIVITANGEVQTHEEAIVYVKELEQFLTMKVLDNTPAVLYGLPLLHGVQIAVDTTLVSPLRRDGTPHSCCAREDGAALRQARHRKERVYPELSGAHGRARLVVLASEVGGRWSTDPQAFLRQLAGAKARQEPPTLRASAKLA